MTEVEQLLDQTYFNKTLWQWTVTAAVAVGVLFVLTVIRRIVRSRYAHMAATPETEFLELPLKVASRTTATFILIASLYAGLQFLELSKKSAKFALTVMTIAAFWQVGVWASSAVTTWLEHRQQVALAKDRAAAGSFGIIGFVARALIWALVFLLTLDNLGIEIKPLLAGLGIGGIAVALAVQNVLGDLFASLSITL